MTFSIMTFSIMTSSIMTFSIGLLSVVMLSVAWYYYIVCCYAECRYTECRYTECRDALPVLNLWIWCKRKRGRRGRGRFTHNPPSVTIMNIFSWPAQNKLKFLSICDLIFVSKTWTYMSASSCDYNGLAYPKQTFQDKTIPLIVVRRPPSGGFHKHFM